MNWRLTIVLTAALAFGQSPAHRVFYNPYGSSGGDTAVYTVKAGETLFDIADNWLGDAYRAKELQELNGIEDPLRLKTGMELKVPRPRRQIRYSLQILTPDGSYQQAPAGMRVSRDDRFRLRLESNMRGYLYVFSRDAKGRVKPLLPMPGEKARLLRQFGGYTVPGAGWLRLDRARGDEELVLMVAAEPLPVIDTALLAQDDQLLSAAAQESVRKLTDEESLGKGVDIDNGSTGDTVVSAGPVSGTEVIVHVIKLNRK